ncbi:MAG: hypothetical protein RL685_4626 [Pseudomonadota bacterium]|jgi:hypothetical protein
MPGRRGPFRARRGAHSWRIVASEASLPGFACQASLVRQARKAERPTPLVGAGLVLPGARRVAARITALSAR